MKQMLMSMAVCLAACAAQARAAGDCGGCTTAKAEEGWCGQCKVGFAYGVTIKSEKLYQALQPKDAKIESCPCSDCKTAFAENGCCTACRMWFQGGKLFFSPVAARLAAGKPMSECQPKCQPCKDFVASKGKEGCTQAVTWCDDCKAGVVSGRVYTDRKAWDEASAAREVLVKAAEARCEGCALALAKNGTCEACKVSFTDGKMAKK